MIAALLVMHAHLVEIETSRDCTPGKLRHRWRCSCGRAGHWHAWSARVGGPTPIVRAHSGGARHIADMERGR